MGYSYYSFLLEAESTAGSRCGRKDYFNKKPYVPIRNRTRGPLNVCLGQAIAANKQKISPSCLVICNVLIIIVELCSDILAHIYGSDITPALFSRRQVAKSSLVYWKPGGDKNLRNSIDPAFTVPINILIDNLSTD
jgi:hypothetical protein